MKNAEHGMDWETLAWSSHNLGQLESSALTAWREGDIGATLRILDRLIRLNPYEPGYHELRAAALAASGQFGEALKAIERAGTQTRTVATCEELKNWQQQLIAQLRHEDPVFRAHFLQDPVAACRARGFHIEAAHRSASSPLAGALNRLSSNARPS